MSAYCLDLVFLLLLCMLSFIVVGLLSPACGHLLNHMNMMVSCIGYTWANVGICCRRVAGVADVSESPAEMTIRSYSVSTCIASQQVHHQSSHICIVKSKCSFHQICPVPHCLHDRDLVFFSRQIKSLYKSVNQKLFTTSRLSHAVMLKYTTHMP